MAQGALSPLDYFMISWVVDIFENYVPHSQDILSTSESSSVINVCSPVTISDYLFYRDLFSICHLRNIKKKGCDY